jgi:hypothetical protein
VEDVRQQQVLAPGDFQDCRNGPVPFNATFENNIVFASGPPAGIGGNAVASGQGCTFRNNVVSPQPTALPNNIISDPQFVNLGARDYHLTSTSPARDAAVPGALPSDHDIDGVSRPQGSLPDIGAFELKP